MLYLDHTPILLNFLYPNPSLHQPQSAAINVNTNSSIQNAKQPILNIVYKFKSVYHHSQHELRPLRQRPDRQCLGSYIGAFKPELYKRRGPIMKEDRNLLSFEELSATFEECLQYLKNSKCHEVLTHFFDHEHNVNITQCICLALGQIFDTLQRNYRLRKIFRPSASARRSDSAAIGPEDETRYSKCLPPRPQFSTCRNPISKILLNTRCSTFRMHSA